MRLTGVGRLLLRYGADDVVFCCWPSLSVQFEDMSNFACGDLISVWTLCSDTARRTSLARHPRPGDLQAGSDSSPVSERPRTTVSVGLWRPSRRCWHSAASAFHQPSTACSTSLPAQHLRPSGFFGCRPHRLELSPGFHLDPTISSDCFRRLLKTYLFARY